MRPLSWVQYLVMPEMCGCAHLRWCRMFPKCYKYAVNDRDDP